MLQCITITIPYIFRTIFGLTIQEQAQFHIFACTTELQATSKSLRDNCHIGYNPSPSKWTTAEQSLRNENRYQQEILKTQTMAGARERGRPFLPLQNADGQLSTGVVMCWLWLLGQSHPSQAKAVKAVSLALGGFWPWPGDSKAMGHGFGLGLSCTKIKSHSSLHQTQHYLKNSSVTIKLHYNICIALNYLLIRQKPI